MKFLSGLKEFVCSTTGLVILFTAAMLVPNFVLACTEPYTFTTIMALIAIPAGGYLLWSVLSRHTGTMVLWALPMMILCAFQLVITYLFGNSIIAVDMFTNLFTTNVSEAGELLGSIYPSVIIVCVIYIPLLALAIRSAYLKQRLNPVYRKKAMLTGLVLLVIGGGFASVSKIRNSDFKLQYHIFPINIWYNIGLSVERWGESRNYPESSRYFSFDAVREHNPDLREIYVMVIGEASRGSSWSLLGYERETNPLLSKTEGVVPFRDVLTQSNTTHKSVPLMLSSVSAENFDDIYDQRSVVSLFTEAGFHTAFISNQPPNRSLIDFFALEADTIVNVTPQELIGKNQHYDGDITPHLERLIRESDDNMFIVIHMYGSHANHYMRYPREFARFLPDEAGKVSVGYRDELINAYDNSILYTDYVLSEIIRTLDETDACSALLFCSDHGEDVLDDERERFLHASPTTTYYQLHVASFAWFSPEYRYEFPQDYAFAQQNAGVPASTSALFHTLADMAAIESPYIDKSYSLVSTEWLDRPRLYVTDYNESVNVLNTGLGDADLTAFDRHGIRYDIRDLKRRRY